MSDLTFRSGGERDGGGVTGERASKPVTAVQACVSTFVKPLNIFDKGQQCSTFLTLTLTKGDPGCLSTQAEASAVLPQT